MHHFRHHFQRLRLHVCVVSFIGSVLAIAAAGLSMATGLLSGHRGLMWTSLGLFGVWAVLGLLYLLTVKSACCPLCRGALMFSQGCSRHRRAFRLLGSSRLGVAIPVLMFRRFRCPYCGELCSCRPKRVNDDVKKTSATSYALLMSCFFRLFLTPGNHPDSWSIVATNGRIPIGEIL